MTTATEHDLITQAALDYFEGWFDGDVARMDRALHADLVKRGVDDESEAESLCMTTKQRMLELTATGQGAQEAEAAGSRRLDVTVVDVYGDIASVTVRSAVYREYLHLVRTRDGWKIANALWRPT
jgi:Putative lumazine-binding